MAKRKIEVIASSSQYFNDLTLRAAQQCTASTDSQTLSYIASLLNKAVKSSINDTSPFLTQAFIEMLSKPISEQLRVSQTIGDCTLMLTGLFSDSLHARLLDMEYYVSIGKTSYEVAYKLCQSKDSGHVFLELSDKYMHYLEVLHRVSQAIGLVDMTNILNVYEKWLHTQSPHLRNLLAAHGIPIHHAEKPKPTKQ